MKAIEIKSDLFNKIERLNLRQLKEVYGLFQNYFNSNETVEEWNNMSPRLKEKIENGIQEADANIVKPLPEVTARLRRKYGVHG